MTDAEKLVLVAISEHHSGDAEEGMKIARAAIEALNTATLAAYALNLLHGAALEEFERDNLVELAGRVGVVPGVRHAEVGRQRAARDAETARRLGEQDRLREALRKCGDRFREYERLHSLKPEGSGAEKAAVNREMAEMVERVLGEK